MHPEPEIPAPGNYRRRRGLGQASPHALQATFQRFSIHSELHTIVWENGADFSPEFLHQQVRATA